MKIDAGIVAMAMAGWAGSSAAGSSPRFQRVEGKAKGSGGDLQHTGENLRVTSSERGDPRTKDALLAASGMLTGPQRRPLNTCTERCGNQRSRRVERTFCAAPSTHS